MSEVKKKRRSLISKMILVIALAVFLYSAYQLYTIYSEYRRGEKEYEQLLKNAVTEEPDTGEDAKAGEENRILFKVDFDRLFSINQETVAWLRFEQPEKISYPVVQGSDNNKYLKTTFEGKGNSSGAIFMDAACASDFSNKNTFIYGHNMKNGSMFGQLHKYRDASFCKEYPYFYIYTPDGKEVKYQIFAVGIVESNAESYRGFYADENAYLQYLKHIRSISRYDTGVEVTADSQIVSLSTCTNVTETQRMIVHGVKISERIAGE